MAHRGNPVSAEKKRVNPLQYVYQYKDHLGNVRLSYTDANNNGTIENGSTYSEIIKENNYYPFGLEHKGYNNSITGAENNHKTYQGKELEKELGLDWHDFGARRFMADIGRWTTIDPLSSEFPSWSPYNAMNDNPIKYVDPTGMAPEDWVFHKETEQYVWDGNVTSATDTDLQEGYEYVGASTNDVGTHYKENFPVKSMLGVNPSFGENLTPLPTTVKSKENTWLEDWSSGGSFLKKTAYDVANSYYLGVQTVDMDLLGEDYTNPFTGARSYTNLDGSAQYDIGERTLSFITSAAPMLGEVKLLSGVKTLNASQFSSSFKGTFIPRASAKVRGMMNRAYNVGVKTFNNKINQLSTAIKTLGGFYSE